MRRYTQARYAPYLRVRGRTPQFGSVRLIPAVRNFVLLLRFVLCVVCFVFALNGMTDHFRGAVENICEYKAAQLVGEYIDRGVLQATSLYPEKNFVHIERSPQGQVTSVETDAIEVNRFAAVLSESILKEMQKREREIIKAPLGAFTGNGLLSALGFSIPYRVVPAGKVTIAPVSGFDHSGINQTVHRLQIEVSVNIRILFPLMKREESVKRTIILSETVIIGDVPNTLLTKGLP